MTSTSMESKHIVFGFNYQRIYSVFKQGESTIVNFHLPSPRVQRKENNKVVQSPQAD